MEKQNNQKKYSNIIIVILLVVSLIIVTGFVYYKYKDIKDTEERIAKQHEERKAVEEKVKQNMLKVHKIDKTPLAKEVLKEKALEYLNDLNVKSSIVSEEQVTEKDINNKDKEIVLYQYTLENGAVLKLLPYGLMHSYKDEKKINNLDNEWKKVKPTETFIKQLETKINDNFKKMVLLKDFTIRDIIDYKDNEQFRLACKNMGSKGWKTNNSKYR
jgi:hypothetical protein